VMGDRSEPSMIHAAGTALQDAGGRQLLLRGVGLGNWLLCEGYMWRFEPPGPQSGRQIEVLVDDLVGPARAQEFWQAFRDTYITEADIAAIAAEGLDHVRLPLNARFLIDDSGDILEEGFTYVDNLIEWCRRHGLWVILDLHGAPGGQTGTNIDDSPRGLPELFVSDHHRELTVHLWREIARRYVGNPTVGGYDLLNEPLPNEYQFRYARELTSLYRELTHAIRQVDSQHLLIYEGSHWATNWSMFDSVWDPNSMLQFHKYWSPPDAPSIRRFVEVGERLQLPIYMGEGGENNTEWLQTAFELYEHFGISWNLWPWKKLETITSPLSVDCPVGWDRIRDYAAGRGPQPGPTEAWDTLIELVVNSAVDRCTPRPDVLNACLRRPPLRFGAAGFGFGGEGVSYGTSGRAAPLVGYRNDDNVTIEYGLRGEPESLNFNHNAGEPRGGDEKLTVLLRPGDWVTYHFDPPHECGVRVNLTAHGGPVESSVAATPDGRATVRVSALAEEVRLQDVQVVPTPLADRSRSGPTGLAREAPSPHGEREF